MFKYKIILADMRIYIITFKSFTCILSLSIYSNYNIILYSMILCVFFDSIYFEVFTQSDYYK